MNPYERIEKTGLILITVLPAIFIFILVIAQWPKWWMWTIFERTPMTWLQSILLVCCALLALSSIALCTINRQFYERRIFLFICLGYAYLALDERFALHERMRDKFLAPNDISVALFPWVDAGNFILLLFLIIGIVALPWILKIFSQTKSKITFIAGVMITALAVTIDSVEWVEYSLNFQRWQQFLEEILETTAMVLFLCALFLTVIMQLKMVNKNS